MIWDQGLNRRARSDSLIPPAVSLTGGATGTGAPLGAGRENRAKARGRERERRKARGIKKVFTASFTNHDVGTDWLES